MHQHVSSTRFFFALRLIVVAIFCVNKGTVEAYEQSTHAALTREAYVQSMLNPTVSDLLLRLGLDGAMLNLGTQYLDVTTNATIVREASPPFPPRFVDTKIGEANNPSVFKPTLPSLAAWLMLGAIREDDGSYDAGALENTPQDEPDGAFTRVFNHFFDPYFDRPLVVGGPWGARAPDWALVVPTAGTRNHFTVRAGREAMWRALTLKQIGAGGILTDVPFLPSFGIVTDDLRYREALRTAYWATTFRALGDVAHLLQDMAQPQHTRNDPHAGLGCSFVGCLGGHASYFERYVDARATGAKGFTLRERFFRSANVSDIAESVAANALSYAGYPIPRFNGYRDYFATALGASSASGLGLANYSNQGFYSTGTNIYSGAEDYPSPPPTGAGLTLAVLPAGTVKNANGESVRGVLTLWKGPVADSSFPDRSELNVSLSSRGAFDQFLAPGSRRYGLNHYNYEDQARLLIARAAAYSAGLIDYFFRGKMEVSLPDEGVYSILDHSKFAPPAPETNPLLDFKGFNKIRLRLKNTTDDITPPQGQAMKQEMSGGTLVAVLKFRRNLCYVDSLDNEITDAAQAEACRNPTEEIVVSDPLTNQSLPFASNPERNGPELTFVFQKELPINAWDVVLQVVYRGKLGSEDDAVVVTSKDISEPTFAAIYNDTDYVYLNGTCYLPEVIAGSDGLWNQLAPACKDSTGSSRKVSDSCAKVPLNIRYTFGTAAKSVIVAMERGVPNDGRLTQRHFGRIGVLGETGTPLSFTLDFHNAPLYLSGGDTEPESLGTYIVQKETQVAGKYRMHRGVKIWDATIFIVDGISASVGVDCPQPNQDLLKDAERYPSALTITGWDSAM